MKIGVVITCFNRRELTIGCISNLVNAAKGTGISLEIYIVDGGSTDGTFQAISEKFSFVKIEKHQNLYWNQGMKKAWENASDKNLDGYLWINDDLHVFNDSISQLESFIYSTKNAEILVGQTISGQSSIITYGGLKRSDKFSKLSFRKLNSNEYYADTMNGNFVYVPEDVFLKIGGLSGKFSHSMGDIDYGLRASKSGIKIQILSEAVGFQEYNADWSKKTRGIGLSNAFFLLFHPKGVPINEWFYFCKSHGGYLWPVNFLLRYVRYRPKS